MSSFRSTGPSRPASTMRLPFDRSPSTATPSKSGSPEVYVERDSLSVYGPRTVMVSGPTRTHARPKGELGMSRTLSMLLVVCIALSLISAACAGDEKDEAKPNGADKVDYAAVGLWDDGPCDPAKPKLAIGLMTVFESPVVSLKDQATALQVSAEAFNKRGGANGSCIEVHICDDGADADKAVACVREIDEAGVVATVNDQGTAGQADVSAAMAAAGIPRIASNVTNADWGDQNAYPLDPSGTGGTFLHPEALRLAGANKIGLIRVDLPQASALKGLLEDLYK